MVARNRLVISGTMPAGDAEAWSVGLNFGPGSGALLTTPEELNAWADSVENAIQGLATTHPLVEWLSNAGTFRQVQTYYYPGPGPALASGFMVVAPAKAGSSTINTPLQCARVITLQTALAGRRFRGRIYWPALANTISTNGKADASQADATAIAAFLESLEAFGAETDRLQLSVYSSAADLLTPVSSVRIDDVIDTQRRRTESLVPIRYSAPLP